MQDVTFIQALNLLEKKANSLNVIPFSQDSQERKSIQYVIKRLYHNAEGFDLFSQGSEKLEFLLLVSFFTLSYRHMFGHGPNIKSNLNPSEDGLPLPVFLSGIEFGTCARDTVRNIEAGFKQDISILHNSTLLKNNSIYDKIIQLLRSEKFVSFSYNEFTNQDEIFEGALNVYLFRKGEDLVCELSSNSKEIDETSLHGLVHVMEAYLKDIKNSIGLSVEKLPRLVLDVYNEMLSIGTAEIRPVTEDTVIRQFIDQAEKTPRKIALEINGQKWTYEEINERSTKIANLLVEVYAVMPGDKVGVLLDRNEHLIIILLAILKAGASYVPLDKKYPEERIRFILEDSKVKSLIVNTKGIQSDFEVENLIKIEDLDEKSVNYKFSSVGMDCQCTVDFYLIYTSGSTGRPKGCQITHQNVINLFDWAKDNYNEEELSRVLASTSICFDLSIFEIFLPLTMGGTIVLVENLMELLTLDELPSVSLINSIPSLIQELVNSDKLPKTANVVNMAGEQIQRKLIQQLNQKYSVKKLWNLYGPSETTTYSTFQLVDGSKFDNVCIGKPIYNTKLIVLDDDLQPVPYGYPGELFIGGKGLSSGYWNRDELNETSFVSFSHLGASDLYYKTGDIVVWNADQTLRFLGRSDNQVKIRGLRIELDEIEYLLIQLKEIEQVKVSIIGSSDDHVKIVAFYQAKEELAYEILYNHCLKHLPKYHIPQEFVHFNAIYRTPNGKIDAKRLNTFYNNKASNHYGNLPVLTDVTMTRLMDLIGSIANQTISGDTNLYEAGFSSIDFIKLLVRVQKEFHIEIKISQLFHEATPFAIAKVIREAEKGEGTPLKPAVSKELYPATFTQERFWQNAKILSEVAELFNIPLIICWKKPLDFDRLEEAWNRLLGENEILRTNFVFKGDHLFQKIKPHKYQRIEVCHSSGNDGNSISDNDFFKSIMDLEEGSLANIKLIKKSETLYYILFNFHHSIVDGWSVELMFKRLLNSYYQREANKAPQFQFKDFSEHYHLQLNKHQNEKEYWHNKLSLTTEPLKIFNNYSTNSSFEGHSYVFKLEEVKVAKVKEIFKDNNASLFQGITSILGVLLRKYGNKGRIAVGMPSSNRYFEVFEDLPGLFLNVLLFHLDLSNSQSYRDFLKNVKEEISTTLDHQGFPLDAIIKENYNDYSANFDVFIAYQEFGLSKTSFLGDDIEMIPYPVKYAKHTLSIYFYETLEGLQFSFEYQKAKISDNHILRMVKHFNRIIEAIIEDEEIEIDKISIIDDDEERLLMDFENGPKLEVPSVTLFELFERNFQAGAENTALQHKNNTYSFAYCNHYAKIVHSTLNQNITLSNIQQSVIAIDLPDGVKRVAAVLGVLRYGGIVLLIQPDFPEERKRSLLLESDALMCIVSSFSELYNESNSLIMPEYSAEEIDLEIAKVDISHNAWLIFTSGSTNKPKGVMLNHQNACNMLFWFVNYFRLGVDDVLPQKTNISFVDSLVELLSPLCITSGTVYLRPYEDITKSPTELNSWLNSINATHIQFVPEIFEGFYSEIKSVPKSLKHLLLSGNKISKYIDLACQTYNVYGASETTAYCLSRRITSKEEIQSIGRPISNTTVRIIDSSGERVPIGIKGELYVSGDMVFEGYLNYNEQPFLIDKSNTKWYKTNDLVSWAEDGMMIFHGRIGSIVKVNGVRIDLSEIEFVLCMIPGVEKAIAKAMEVEGKEVLVAFLLTNIDVTLKDIQNKIKSELPSYAKPTFYRKINKLPINPNGKINKMALDLSIGTVPEYGGKYVAPVNNTERELVRIVENLTRQEGISVEDNYFDLGVNSIDLIKLESQISNNLSKISVSDFFNYPDIKSLAFFLDKRGNDQALDLSCLENKYESTLNRKFTTDDYNSVKAVLTKDLSDNLLRISGTLYVQRDIIVCAIAGYTLSYLLESDTLRFCYFNGGDVYLIELDLQSFDSKEDFIVSFKEKVATDGNEPLYTSEQLRIAKINPRSSGMIISNLPLEVNSDKVFSLSDVNISISDLEVGIHWRTSYLGEDLAYKILNMTMTIIESFFSVSANKG